MDAAPDRAGPNDTYYARVEDEWVSVTPEGDGWWIARQSEDGQGVSADGPYGDFGAAKVAAGQFCDELQAKKDAEKVYVVHERWEPEDEALARIASRCKFVYDIEGDRMVYAEASGTDGASPLSFDADELERLHADFSCRVAAGEDHPSEYGGRYSAEAPAWTEDAGSKVAPV